MEVRHGRSTKNAAETKRRAVIVEWWAELGKPPVDARLLKTIQSRLTAAVHNHEISPAVVARIFADEGAELKHPEIIETDAAWREARIETNAKELERLSSAQVMTLGMAEKFIDELEQLRKQYELNEDRQALAQVRTIASELRRLAESVARNRLAAPTVRVEQAEIAEWLKVWLQTPNLFADWLDLRHLSPEFRKKFSNKKTT